MQGSSVRQILIHRGSERETNRNYSLKKPCAINIITFSFSLFNSKNNLTSYTLVYKHYALECCDFYNKDSFIQFKLA